MSKASPKIGFVSLGCPKATVDAEHILTQMRAEGYLITPSYQEADLVVVNTCGFIDSAVAESLDAIGEALHENGKVIVTGCLGAKGDIVQKTHPKVLAVTGPHAADEVMAAVTRVISYDRAGMNFSDIGPIERAPGQDVRDLRELLQREKIPGPYVFVGWSAGGMIVRWYASLHPEETAAVITVDGSDFDYWDPQAPDPDWLANAIKRFRDARDAAEQKLFDKDPGLLARSSLMINPLHFYTPMREALAERAKDPRAYAQTLHHLEHMKESNDGLRRVWKHLGPIPLRVLVAGEHVVKNNRDFLDHAYRIAGMSNDGLMIVVPGTTHGMHLDKPDPIVEQINDMVLRIRARRSAAR